MEIKYAGNDSSETRFAVGSALFTIILFFVFPLAALPFIVYDVYRQKKYAYVLLALFVGLFAIYYPPFGDQYRYWLDYHSILDNNLEFLLTIPEQIKNPKAFFSSENLLAPRLILNNRLSLITLLEMLFKSMNLPIEFMRFVLVSFCGIVCFLIAFDLREKWGLGKDISAYSFWLFIAYALCFPFFSICEGYRQGCGMTFLLWSMYTIFFKKKYFWGIVLYLITIWFHSLYIIALLALFAIPLFKAQKETWFYVILSAGLICFGSFLLSFLIPYITPTDTLQDLRLETYFAADGNWRIGEKYKWSLKHRIVDQMKIFAFFLYVVFFYYFSRKKIISTEEGPQRFCEQKVCIWLYCFCLFFFGFIQFHTVSERLFLSLFLFVGLFLYYMGLFLKTKNREKFVLVFLFFSSFFFLNIFLRVYPGLRIGDFPSFITSSFYSMATYSYDEQFILTHIYEDGGLD